MCRPHFFRSNPSNIDNDKFCVDLIFFGQIRRTLTIKSFVSTTGENSLLFNRREFSLVRTGENSLLFEQERILSCSNRREFSPVRTRENSLLFEQERILACSNKREFSPVEQERVLSCGRHKTFYGQCSTDLTEKNEVDTKLIIVNVRRI